MFKEIPQNTQEMLHRLIEAAAKQMGYDHSIAVHIQGVRVCDRCKEEEKEAFPWNAEDNEGRYWQHVCNECADELGLFETDDDEALQTARWGLV